MRVDAIFQSQRAERDKRAASKWPELVNRLIVDCHPEQRAFVLDPSRYVAEIVGRGGGKTDAMIRRFLRRMLSRAGSNCYYVAKTRDHAKSVIWRQLKAAFRSLGLELDVDVIYNETELTARLPRNDSQIKLIGADKIPDVDSIRGLTYHEVGIDEMGAQKDQVVRYLIDEVFGPRLVGALTLGGTAGPRRRGLWYDVTGPKSTISRLWANRDREPENQWSLHRWTLASAIEATKDRPIPELLELRDAQLLEITTKQWTPTNPKRRREIDAEWAEDNTENVYNYVGINDDGVPWNQWDPPRVGPMRIADLPPGFVEWIHVISIDLGSTDPTAINLFSTALDDVSRTVYHRFCFEKKRMYAREIACVLVGEDPDRPEQPMDISKPSGLIGAIGSWPNGMIADATHAQATLDELANVYLIHVEAATKAMAYKTGAIAECNSDLYDGRMKVLKGSELETQMMSLQWTIGRNGLLVEAPGQPNHSTDCAIYGRQLLGTFMTVAGEPPPPAGGGDQAAAPAGPPPRQQATDGESAYDDSYGPSAYDDDD